MAEFDGEALGLEAVRILYYYVTMAIGPRMYRFWGTDTLPDDLLEQYRQAPLYKDIQLLARVANGEIERHSTEEYLLDEVLAAAQQGREDLRTPPSGVGVFALTDEFSRTPLGRMLERVEYWLVSPDLMTLSEAAALYTGRFADLSGLKVIQRLITRGEKGRREGLQVTLDPFEPNPQHNKRVRRSEVERLKAERGKTATARKAERQRNP